MSNPYAPPPPPYDSEQRGPEQDGLGMAAFFVALFSPLFCFVPIPAALGLLVASFVQNNRLTPWALATLITIVGMVGGFFFLSILGHALEP